MGKNHKKYDIFKSIFPSQERFFHRNLFLIYGYHHSYLHLFDGSLKTRDTFPCIFLLKTYQKIENNSQVENAFEKLLLFEFQHTSIWKLRLKYPCTGLKNCNILRLPNVCQKELKISEFRKFFYYDLNLAVVCRINMFMYDTFEYIFVMASSKTDSFLLLWSNHFFLNSTFPRDTSFNRNS